MTDDLVDDFQGRFRVLDLQVDLGRETVSRAKQAIDLPELSFRLFAVLIRHAPHRVSKDELITEVWNDVVVSDETLAQRVRLLRQALGEDSQNPRYFSSVRGRGYRMICDVKPLGDPASSNKTRNGLMGAALLAIVALLFFNNLQDDSPPAPSANSIAVLPFADLSAIIEGSVRIDGDRVRITVQLIDAQSDQHLWADNFDSTLSVQNIFSIQEEVATRIAEAMQLEYMRDAEPEPVQLPTGSLDAYSAYLLGRYHTFRQTPDDLELAVANLERATTLDPEFAEAFASLGWAYSFLGTSYGNVPPREVYPQAKEAALNAFALDSDLAEVYFAAGDVDNGFVFLQRAVDARAREMIFLQVNRSLNDWHDDPRYLDLVKAIGFPSQQ